MLCPMERYHGNSLKKQKPSWQITVPLKRRYKLAFQSLQNQGLAKTQLARKDAASWRGLSTLPLNSCLIKKKQGKNPKPQQAPLFIAPPVLNEVLRRTVETRLLSTADQSLWVASSPLLALHTDNCCSVQPQEIQVTSP